MRSSASPTSVRERGLLQPVLVRPVPGGTYELIAGERRWRAAQLAELETIPAIVRPQEDAASLELALIENMAREDLNPVEEARAVAALVEELGLSKEEAGRRLGRSRVAISNLLRLLDLPDEALELIESGQLTQGHGRALLTAPDHDLRRRLAREAAAQGWSVRQTEARCRAPVPGARRHRRPPAAGRAAPGPGRCGGATRRGLRPRTRSRRQDHPARGGIPGPVRLRQPRRGARSGGATGAHGTCLSRLPPAIIARPTGRLAQSVRALL